VTLFVVYSIFLLGCVYGRYLDRKDEIEERKQLQYRTESQISKTTKAATYMSFSEKLKENQIQQDLIKRRPFIASIRYWWSGLKQEHRLLSIIYSKDKTFTRPQRLTILLCVLMGNMLANSLLFQFKGITPDMSPAEVIESKILFAVLASLCTTPIVVILVLLFKRSGASTILADAFLQTDSEGIPDGLRSEVEVRKQILEAEESLAAAKKSLENIKVNMRSSLKVELATAANQGASDITPEAKLAFHERFKAEIRENQRAILEARAALYRAKSLHVTLRSEQKQKMESEINELVKDLKGLEKIRKKRQYIIQKRRDHMLTVISEDDAKLYLAEEEMLKKLNVASRLLYKSFLSPFRPKTENNPWFPKWVSYIVYTLAFFYCSFAGYYVFLFSVMMNTCSSCKCSSGECTDPSDPCNTCPSVMIGLGNQMASNWLQTLLVTFVIGFLISEPGTIFVKHTVLPWLTTVIVNKHTSSDIFTTLRSRLAVDQLAAKKLLAHNVVPEPVKALSSEPEEDEILEPIVLKKTGQEDIPLPPLEPEVLEPIIKTKSEIIKLVEEVPAEEEVLDTVIHGKIEKPSNEFSNAMLSTDLQPSELNCRLCGLLLSRVDLSQHENYECSDRLLTCTYCEAVVKAHSMELHQTMSCPNLRVCRCGIRIQKQLLAAHKSSDCPLRKVRCNLGCGLDIEVTALEIHEMAQCVMRPWECICGITLPFMEKSRHENYECIYRIIICERCGERLMEGDRPEHEADLCTHRPWTCECGITIPLCDHEMHISRECSDPILPCIYRCGFAGRKSERIAHEHEICGLRAIICDCGLRLNINDFEHHRATSCEYREVKCPSCDISLLAKDLALHNTDICPHRTVPCSFNCGRVLEFKDLEGHEIRDCPHRLIPCNTCGMQIPLKYLQAHHRSACRVVPCPDCARMLVASNLASHRKDQCPLRKTACRMCGANVPIKYLMKHEQAECVNRELSCPACSDVLQAHEFEHHNLEICPHRKVKCRRGCGMMIEYINRESHELQDCPMQLWQCQCGEVVQISLRSSHLRTCRAYRDCWEGVLERLVESHSKRDLEKRISAILASGVCTAEEALCALAECGGNVDQAIAKLSNSFYKAEMDIACAACGVNRYVQTKKRKRKHRQGPSTKPNSQPDKWSDQEG